MSSVVQKQMDKGAFRQNLYFLYFLNVYMYHVKIILLYFESDTCENKHSMGQ